MNRGILVFYGLALLGALALTTLMSAGNAPDEKRSLPELAQRVGVPFPAEARLLGARRERGIDEYLEFKAELPEPVLAAFIATLPFANDDAQPGDKAHFGPDHGPFDPSAASFERFYEGRVADRELKLGITAAKNGWVTVYVVSFQT